MKPLLWRHLLSRCQSITGQQLCLRSWYHSHQLHDTPQDSQLFSGTYLSVFVALSDVCNIHQPGESGRWRHWRGEGPREEELLLFLLDCLWLPLPPATSRDLDDKREGSEGLLQSRSRSHSAVPGQPERAIHTCVFTPCLAPTCPQTKATPSPQGAADKGHLVRWHFNRLQIENLSWETIRATCAPEPEAEAQHLGSAGKQAESDVNDGWRILEGGYI